MGDTAGVRDATALAASLMFLANILLFGMTWMVGKKDYTTISGKSTRPNIVELGKWKWPCFCIQHDFHYHSAGLHRAYQLDYYPVQADWSGQPGL